jgi:hypothetical protein
MRGAKSDSKNWKMRDGSPHTHLTRPLVKPAQEGDFLFPAMTTDTRRMTTVVIRYIDFVVRR